MNYAAFGAFWGWVDGLPLTFQINRTKGGSGGLAGHV
jgi:hypothetical protein